MHNHKSIAPADRETLNRTIVVRIKGIGQAKDAGQQLDPVSLLQGHVPQLGQAWKGSTMIAGNSRHRGDVLPSPADQLAQLNDHFFSFLMVFLVAGNAPDLMDSGRGAQQLTVVFMITIQHADSFQAVIKLSGKTGYTAGMLHVRIKKG
jgi:hypothetical protein